MLTMSLPYVRTFPPRLYPLELSLVLVIIGLIVGGIMAGTSLIHQSQLRAMMNDYTEWQIAVRTFKEKYDYFSGDFPYASSIWPNCHPPNVTWCNGNGEGAPEIRTV